MYNTNWLDIQCFKVHNTNGSFKYTQNYERTIQLFKMSTVIKMCEMIWSNLNTVPTPRTGERVTQGTSLHNIIILFFKIDNKTLQSKTQLEAKELTILKLILKKSTK